MSTIKISTPIPSFPLIGGRGKTIAVIDNSYGKNSTYVNAWTVPSELVSQQHHSLPLAGGGRG
ncbi:MAG: hypothetical protein CVU15_02965 [Betaproteobacteria bacterium HGW-Betaproteobacteria-1]|jgi:hypothetical protein|nr:MAG: hypothetical protein CVU15_02965 [Betaproteobacteria bacterium HGW-Betaproteobacteria-1]